jgi:WD40 repeat protein
LVSAGLALLLAVSLGTIISSLAAYRAVRAERHAQQAQLNAEAQERIARQESYANAMLLAHESLESSDIGAVNGLLKKAAGFVVPTATNFSHSLAPWEWRHLKHEIRDEATEIFAECEGSVRCLALSEDEQWLAAGVSPDQVLLWHLPEQRPLRQWRCGAEVKTLAFSPAAARLGIGLRDGRVQVLANPSGEMLMDFHARSDDPACRDCNEILALRFSTDGKRLGSVASIGKIIARMEDKSLFEIPNQGFGAWRAAISSDLQLVIRGGMAGVGLVFSQSGTNAIFPEVIGNPYHKQELAISPDGLWLAVPLADHSIEIWSVKDQDRFRQLVGHTAYVDALAWSPDSRFLVSGGLDQTVMIWHVRGGTLLRKLRGHQRALTALAFSAQDLTVYSGSEDKTVRIWKSSVAKAPPDRMSLSTALNLGQVRLSPGARFFQLDIGQGLRLYETVPFLQTCNTAHLRNGPFYGVSPDGQTAIGVDPSTSQCEVWRRDRAGLFFFTGGGGPGLANAHTHLPCFSRDGRRVAFVNANGTFGIWQVEPWRELARWEGADPQYQGLFLDPPGRRVFAVGINRELVIGDMDRPGIFNLRSPERAGLIAYAAISPDNRFLATGAVNFVHIWAFAPGEQPCLTTTLEDQKTHIRALAFSPDGQRLAFGMIDGQVQIWDFEHRMKVAVLKGHKQPVWQIGFNPDDDSLVSVSPDELRVWRVSQQKTFAP